MGCCGSNYDDMDEWRTHAEYLEHRCYLSFGLKDSQLIRKYVTIKTLDDEPFNVRVVTINEKDKGTKKTLVMTHGAMGCSPTHMRFLTILAETYHIVLFDYLGLGLNTRLQEGEKFTGKDGGREKAEEWLIHFMKSVIDALTTEGHL